MKTHCSAIANEATICPIKHTHAVRPSEETLEDKAAFEDAKSKRLLINEEMNEIIEIPSEGKAKGIKKRRREDADLLK